MESDAQVAERLLSLWERSPTVWGWFATVDHKEIGLRYLVTAFIFLVVGGIEALLIHLQWARPEARLLTPEQYDQIFTMHGVTMIFWSAALSGLFISSAFTLGIIWGALPSLMLSACGRVR